LAECVLAMRIVLIHGLGRSAFSLVGLSKVLLQAGHEPEFFRYTAWWESFDDMVGRLRDRLQTLSTLGPYGIVSHSMGAILTRAALAQADFPLPAHVVMLAPPNQSPQAARLIHSLPSTSLVFGWFSGQCGHNLASPDFYAQLPPLECPYTLIAGTKGPIGPFTPFGQEPNDWIVGLNEVRMRPGDVPVEIPALHSFIMNDSRVKKLTVKAFSEVN
jgi:hypothetical protein